MIKTLYINTKNELFVQFKFPKEFSIGKNVSIDYGTKYIKGTVMENKKSGVKLTNWEIVNCK